MTGKIIKNDDVYDPAENDGVAFEGLPDDWKCPHCKQPIENFNNTISINDKERIDMAENYKLNAESLGDGRYKCPCGYIYDPAKGDPKRGIPAGTKFEDLPDDWRCPRCKRKKEKFEAL